MNADQLEEIQALSETVRRFSQQEIAPHVSAWDEAGEFPRQLYREAAALGLLGLGYPEALGGTPASLASRMAVSVALCRYGGSGGVMASLFSHNIGLPPVRTTWQQSCCSIRPTISSSDRSSPSGCHEVNGVSQYQQRRLQPLVRTKTLSVPVRTPSP